MIFVGCCHRLLQFLAVCSLSLTLASCALVEERIDRAAGGPNVPADIAVQMDLAPNEQPQEITAPAVPPAKVRIQSVRQTVCSRRVPGLT